MPVQDYELPDAEGDKTPGRGLRPPPPPPPGPGPGPGGGFLGGFGGRRPNLFRGLPGLDEATLPVLLRKRGLQMPQGVPGPQGRGDTVPAMLSPGEKVIPTNMAQDPQYGPMLDQLINQGRQQMGGGLAPGEAYSGAPMGFEMGGEVPQTCPHCGAQHFAFGGTVQNRFGGAFGQPGQVPNLAPKPPAAPGGWDRDIEGNVRNFDPANPWGNYQGNQNAYGLGLLYRGVGNAGAAGYFDPRGNQMLINSQLEAAQGDADALVRRQMSQADLGGLDPAQRAAAKLQALRETGRGVQEIGARVRADALGRQDDFFKDQYRTLTNAGVGYSTNEQNARNERIAQQNAQTNANRNWWQPVLGAAIGGAASGFTGGFMGGGGGGGGGGGSMPGSSPYQRRSPPPPQPWGP